MKKKGLVLLALPLVFGIGQLAVALNGNAVATAQPEQQVATGYPAGYAAGPVAAPPAAADFGVNPGGGQRMTTTRSKPWEQIDFGTRKLTNNVWGAPPEEKLTSGVFLKQDGTFGLSWNRQEPRAKAGHTWVQPLYPNVRIGGSPWQQSNSAYFPVKLGDVKSLAFTVAYRYVTVPTGSYNFAYDMFLSDTNKPGPDPRINAEVMIWVQGTAKEPPDSYKGDFQDGHNTYALYSWVMSTGRVYYAFIMKGEARNQASYTVDAGSLLDQLKLDHSLYIHGVELGNEVWSGLGEIEISQLNANLNGHDL